LAVVITYALLRKMSNGLPLPPGFPKKPFIHSFLDLPTEFEWETFAKWSEMLSKSIRSSLTIQS
jgi:hypothetical protein